MRRIQYCFPFLVLVTASALAQEPNSNAPVITLQDAFRRAAQFSGQIQTANIAAQLAREDKKQAQAATLPSVNALNQFIYTEPNGTASGVFVANDGPHVYNEQLVVHEELLALARRGEVRLAAAAEAVAKAKADVAARGLNLTVAQDYYAIVGALRKALNARQSLSEAQQFFDITQKQEHGGEAAHADVIKAQLQLQQRQRDLQDAGLNSVKAKVALAVLIFPSLDLNYSVVDDLTQTTAVPSVAEVQAQATGTSPDLRAAKENVSQSQLGVSVARYGYLPSLGIDFWYGIDANQFSDNSSNVVDTGRSTLPHFEVQQRQNLGYSFAATLTVPVWTWGATHSKVKQAQLRERQAQVDLSLAERQLQSQILSAHQEAEAAAAQLDSLHSSSDLSKESLRLTLLRYQAGEATALEVADAQTTAVQARSAYDDGLVRYRLALAQLQSLTGTL